MVKCWVIHNDSLDINEESTSEYERELENEGTIRTSGEESSRSDVGFIVIIDETPETDADDLSRVDSLLCSLSRVDPRFGCVIDCVIAFTSDSLRSNVDDVCRIIWFSPDGAALEPAQLILPLTKKKTAITMEPEQAAANKMKNKMRFLFLRCFSSGAILTSWLKVLFITWFQLRQPTISQYHNNIQLWACEYILISAVPDHSCSCI